MRTIFLIVLALVLCQAKAQLPNITRVEYWIDSDPGFGKAAPVTITAGQDVQISQLPIPMTSTGIHVVGIRSCDDKSQWSHTNLHTALVVDVPANSVISRIEYWIDNDPGIGKATQVSFTSGTDVSVNQFPVSITGLNPGVHTVGVRSMDAQHQWSHTNFYSLLVIDAPANSQITKMEYWIDNDPGFGKATDVSFTPNQDVSVTQLAVSLSGLNAGVHTIGIRSMDAKKLWGHTNFYAVYIFDKPASPITKVEYFWDNDPGFGNALDSVLSVPVTDISDGKFLLQVPDSFISNSTHKLFIRSMDAKGKWSHTQMKSVNVCGVAPAVAGFEFVISGNEVSFTNTSNSMGNASWNFGDGEKSTVISPFHQYKKSGIYTVTLIVTNACLGGDTLHKTIAIKGLDAINTNHGGNTGAVTVSVTGSGFVNGMKLYLRKTGEQSIFGDTLIVVSSKLMTTAFDLTNKSIGKWDVVAVFPPKDTLVLVNGFTIEKGTEPQLWVNITGDPTLRIGFNQVYTVTYGNKGNTDAVFVPLVVSGLPLGTEIELIQPVIDLDSLEGLGMDTIESYPTDFSYTIQDSTKKVAFTIYYITKISAGTTKTLNFIFHIPSTTPLNSRSLIEIIVGNGLFKSTDGLYRGGTPTLAECNLSIMNKAIKTISDKVIKDAAYKCSTSTESFVKSFYNTIMYAVNNGKKGDVAFVTKELIRFGDIQYKFVGFVTKCAEAAGLTVDKEAKRNFIAFVGKYTWDALVEYDYTTDCIGVYYFHIATWLETKIRNSSDPNEKYGPGGGTNGYFVSENGPMAYTITFENDTAANIAAQTVTVLDTLDKKYFDFKSFGFSSVTIGDKSVSFGDMPKSFIRDFDFTASMGVKARVVGSFDTITGIAKWVFYTIDTATNQITTNALHGFLPPDTLSPLGQGYVSFIVEPNPATKSGDTIGNTATIIFDFNAPIHTSNWQNVFDLEKPLSRVLDNVAPMINSHTFDLHLRGTDNLSGIRNYIVYFSTDSITYYPWITVGANDTTVTFTGTDSRYYFYSIATDSAGNVEDAPLVPDAVTQIITGGKSAAELKTELFQNRPNPFNHFTSIDYYLSSTTSVQLVVYDVLGNRVNEINFTQQQAGRHTVDLNTAALSSGQYYYQLITKEFAGTMKMLLIK